MCKEVKFVYLKNHPLFAEASEQQIKNACSVMKVKKAFRGEWFDYGDNSYSKIYLLIMGKIKIMECDDRDKEIVKDILIAPDIFGDLSLNSPSANDERAEALTANTVVCCFNAGDFKRLLQDHPEMAINYANFVNNKLKRLENRHSDLVFRNARERLIRFIRNWAKTDGSRMGNKIILNNYLTHSDIAGAIATSRQSVNMLLNELKDSGLICYSRKQIELNDLMAWK